MVPTHGWKLQETLEPPSISLTVLIVASLQTRGQAGGGIYFNLFNFLRFLFAMEKWELIPEVLFN